MEEAVLAAVLKHFSLTDTVHGLGRHQEELSPQYSVLVDTLGQAYTKLAALFRILQTIAQMEQQWQDQTQDIRYHQNEVVPLLLLIIYFPPNQPTSHLVLC